MTDLAPYLRSFLVEYLPSARRCSQHTIDSYAYSFQLLVCYAAQRIGTAPSRLKIEQLSADLVLDFLDHLENERKNSVRTRNARLAAINSFFRYLEFRLPACLEQALQVHAIPVKRSDEVLVFHLDRDEMQAVLDAPRCNTVSGVRDRAMLYLAYTAALRVSELVSLRFADLRQPQLNSIQVRGKGRRERLLPLWKETASALRDWLAVRPDSCDDHLFTNSRGIAMTRHGFAYRLKLHVAEAQKKVPSISTKSVTPHSLRRTCAMHTLEATGDIRKVSLWLGHNSLESTQAYLQSDPMEKLEMLAVRLPPSIAKGSFDGVPDELMTILHEVRVK